jgi:hypothetical protein
VQLTEQTEPQKVIESPPEATAEVAADNTEGPSDPEHEKVEEVKVLPKCLQIGCSCPAIVLQ